MSDPSTSADAGDRVPDTGHGPRAVVLAGGLGTRLRPYTAVIPKPLMPVGDRPILDIVMRQLRAAGIDRVTVATGHLAELIEAFFGNGAAYGLAVDYHREHEPLGTVGALALIDGLAAGDEPFLVMNGDVLTDLDHRELVRRHRESGAVATIAVTTRTVQVSLGVMHFDDSEDAARVTDYLEKPTLDYEASMGVYCFDPRALAYIEPGEPAGLPRPRAPPGQGGRARPGLASAGLLARHRPPRGLRAGDGGVRADALAPPAGGRRARTAVVGSPVGLTPDPVGPALRGRTVVCVGFAEWDAELWTNQQHLMSRLARHNDVLFVESLGLRRPQLAGRDLRRLARRLVTGLRGPRRRGRVRVLSPLVLPLHSSARIRALNAWLLRAQVRRAVAAGGGRSTDDRGPVLWSYVPQAEVLLDDLAPADVVYHCVDDIAAQKGIDAAAFRAAEDRFVTRADLVVTSAPALADRLRPRARALLHAPNVADTALFATALEPGPVDAAVAALPGPRIVFTGAVVATKLDLELLAGLARARPAWSVVLVGPVGLGDPSTDVSALAAEPNVHLVGARPYAALPAVLRGADVAVVPYRITELTRSIFPMKVYEYLAAGVPVVTTLLPALAGVPDVVRAEGATAFVAAVERALTDDAPRRARSDRARTHSWDARVVELADALGRARSGVPEALVEESR